MKHGTIAIAILLAGCGESASFQMLPSARSADAPRGDFPLAGFAVPQRPCGYEATADDAQTGMPTRHSYRLARITYNPVGLDVSEDGVDDNELAFRNTTEYDAMGSPVSYRRMFPAAPAPVGWSLYDAFGRLIRASADSDGDGEEDDVTTYVNDRAGYRISAHRVSREGSHDELFHYDGDGRLIAIDSDIGLDGMPQQVASYDYDDIMRVTTKTLTDRSGAVIGGGTTTYDRDNHVLEMIDTTPTPTGSHRAEHRNRYATGRLLTTELVDTEQGATDVAVTTVVFVWRYEHCL